MKYPKKSGLKSSIINIICSEYSFRRHGYDSVPFEKLNMVNWEAGHLHTKGVNALEKELPHSKLYSSESS